MLRAEADAVKALPPPSEASDDGKALDTSGPVGGLGAFVVSLAVLPYVPLSLYSSFILATTGKGLEPGPNGIYGLAEGFATLTVFGVALWSIASRIFRGYGLPAGLLGVLGVAEGLSWLAVATFALAVGLNQLDPEDNPVRGFTFDAPSKSAEMVSSKTIKGIDKASRYIEKETAPSRAALDAAVKDAAKQASESASEASKQASDAIQKQASTIQALKLPELKVNTERINKMEAAIKSKLPGAAKDPVKEPTKEPTNDSAKEAAKEPAKEPSKVP